ncbi:hypothetical protein [Flavobacterium hydatis]|nr:hypothetical protein [Flavobacterium hydatis]
MKRLEDFECEKVEVKNVVGGGPKGQAYTFCQVKGQELNDFDGMDPNT